MTDQRLRQNGQPPLTDLYQITMAYAYWKSGKTKDHSVFDLFFPKNPFHGEFTIFAGLEDCLKFLEKFHYSVSDIAYFKQTLPSNIDEHFYEFLSSVSAKDITVYAIAEGSVVFPRVPLLRVEGPLIIVQLLEATLLTLVNYASLMTTHAARYRMAAGNVKLLDFGLSKAQGPDGGVAAAKYSYLGGFDGTSNVLAGELFGIPIEGTYAHAYITSFEGFTDLCYTKLEPKPGGEPRDLLQEALTWRTELLSVFKVTASEANDGELAALISMAIAFPDGFIALVDTYDVMRSGLLNFCSVALTLNDLRYRAVGVRLDSGDLAYLSKMAREFFNKISEKYDVSWFTDLTIMVSNDISEETILSLNEQGHEIDCIGISTHLVTCRRQPVLGCVNKLVQLNDQPRIRLNQDVDKVTMPGRKDAYRLYNDSGEALVDLLQISTEPLPVANGKVYCRHPFTESKRAYVIPARVERLLSVYWKDGAICQTLPNLQQIKERVQTSLKTLRPDIKRNLNPTPFKVAVSDCFYTFLHDLWLENVPIGELS